MTTVAIVGATGGVGQHAVRHALGMGHTVRALARTPSKLSLQHTALTVLKGDVLDPASLAELVDGADMVLSCLGTPRGSTPVVCPGTDNLLKAMQAAQIDRFAFISSVGVGDSLDQAAHVSWLFRYLAMPLILRSVMADLHAAEKLARRTAPATVIVRPTGLRDSAGTGRWHATDAAARRNTTTFMARDDVGHFMASLVSDTQHDGHAVSLFAG